MIEKILNFTSKILHIDAEYFIKNFSYLSIINVIGLIGGFLSAILFARFVPQEIYGKYQFILTFHVGFAAVSLLGMRTAVVQAVSRGYEKTYKAGLKSSVYFSCIGSAGLILMSLYYFNIQKEFDLAYLFIFSALTFIPSTLSNFYSTYLEGRKEFKKSSTYTARILLISNIILLTVIYFAPSLKNLVYAYIVPPMLIGIYLTVKIYRSSLEGEVDENNIKFGKNLSLILAIVNGAFYYDKTVTGIFIGFKALAELKFAEILPEQIKGLIKNLQIIALPKLSTMSNDDIRRHFLKKLIQLMGLTSILVLIYIAIAKYLFMVFFPVYIQSVVYSNILALSIIPAAGCFLIGSLFESQKKTKALAWIHYSYAITQLILVSGLAFLFGIWGIIFARFLVRLCNFLIGLYFVYKL